MAYCIVKTGTRRGQEFAIFDSGSNQKDGHCRKRYFITRLNDIGGRNAINRSNSLPYIAEKFEKFCD